MFSEDDADMAANYTPTTPVLNTSKAQRSLDDQYIGIIIGALAALILLLFVIIIIIILRHRRRKYNNNHRSMKSIQPRHATLDMGDLTEIQQNTLNGKLSNGNMYNGVANSDGESDREGTCCVGRDLYYQDPVDSLHGIQTRKLPELPRTPESTGMVQSNVMDSLTIKITIRNNPTSSTSM